MNAREVVLECVGYNHLFQDKNQWQALVNMVTNIHVPWKAGNFLTS